MLANVQLTAQQTAALSGLCDGSESGFAATKFQQGVLILGDGQPDPVHEDLPASIQADSYAETGLILCLDYHETEIDLCDYWLFDVPRVRLDVEARLISVRSPANAISSMSMNGQEPPSCSLAGIITSRTKKISGEAPDASALMDFLNASGANLNDSDSDGLSNMLERISGTDPEVFDEADVTSLITVNGSTRLEVVESENVTLALDFDPGNYSNQTADYSVWISNGDQIFSYVLGSGFEETPLPEIAVRGKAKKFRNFPLTILPTFGSGDYQLNFSVAIGGEVISNAIAMLSVISNEWVFEEVGLRAGIDHQHGFLPEDDDLAEELTLLVSGVAAGDYDKDGWVDLYFTQGDIGKNLLYRNLGNGSFIEVAEEAGVDIALPANVIDDDTQAQNSGATFADYDGDGWLDLMVNGINKTTQPILFRNNQDGTFSDVTQVAKIPIVFESMSSSFADYDKDGDLDFLITHWMSNAQEKRLFRQNADNTFTDVSETAGLEEVITNGFTGNFADINNDGWLDILIAADFGTSQVFMSDGDGTFTTVTGPEITDDFGMGATVGDFDNDG
ncbi:MAG: VCBS repeat-containing protein, partial [Gammaproteobacteria bacterium]|nr:VCBS repeat-containing protein [Gammaproteobacteria bacterium]